MQGVVSSFHFSLSLTITVRVLLMQERRTILLKLACITVEFGSFETPDVIFLKPLVIGLHLKPPKFDRNLNTYLSCHIFSAFLPCKYF